jgi:hypothetical protein
MKLALERILMSNHYEHTITFTIISDEEHLEGKHEDALDVEGLLCLLKDTGAPAKIRDVTTASYTESQITHLLETDYEADPTEYFDALSSSREEFDNEEEMD